MKELLTGFSRLSFIPIFMKILYSYLKNYKGLIATALFLAATSQVFSLLDPHITGKIVDNFIEKKDVLARQEFVNGILYLVGLAVGAARGLGVRQVLGGDVHAQALGGEGRAGGVDRVEEPHC